VTQRRAPRGRPSPRHLLVAGLVLLAAMAGLVAVRGTGTPRGAGGTPTAAAAFASPRARTTAVPSSPTRSPAGESGPAESDTGESDTGGRAAGRPVRLEIPAIDVHSRLERLGTDAAGTLVPPRHPLRAGWYAAGPAPGDLGPAVLAGHVDSRSGPAVFWRLSSLQRGDRLAVTRADGRTVRFRVTSVRHVDRARFPTQAVYGPVPDRALRLITCGGTYDHAQGRYRQNVVVFALAV
jgi:sortase (surface protein transpeptidase)